MAEDGGKRPIAPRFIPGIRWVCCWMKAEQIFRLGLKFMFIGHNKHATLTIKYFLFLCSYTFFSLLRTHIHGSDIIVICLPHFLHDFLFGQAARFDRALHRNCPLWVIKGQILESA